MDVALWRNMRKPMLFIVVLIGAGVARSAAQTAQKPMQACALLTSSEVAAASGGTATPHESNLGGTGDGCMWGGAGNQNMISVSIAPSPQGASREALFAKLNETNQQLKAQGWTEVKKDFGNGTCSAMTPPASSKKDTPAMTSCLADVKGKLVNVVYMSPTGAPIEKVKPLLDKAIGRVP
jgi:hypothetical protein